MKDLENNKILASVLVAGLIALFVGKIADGLYHPVKNPEKRGFKVEVAESSNTAVAAEPVEEKIDVAALMAASDLEKGKKEFGKKCASCHSYETGGSHKVGPNLANIVGSKIAGKDGYSYSSALKEKGVSWTHEELFAFLKSPRKYAKGTKMSFGGYKKPAKIANIVKFLENSN